MIWPVNIADTGFRVGQRDLAPIDRTAFGNDPWHHTQTCRDPLIDSSRRRALDQGRVHFAGRPVQIQPGAGIHCRKQRRTVFGRHIEQAIDKGIFRRPQRQRPQACVGDEVVRVVAATVRRAENNTA